MEKIGATSHEHYVGQHAISICNISMLDLLCTMFYTLFFLRSSIDVSGLVYGIASDPDSGGIAVQLVDGTILKLDAGKKRHTVLKRTS